MKSFGLTDKGKVRADNQDSFAIRYIDARQCTVAVICDGMGGQNAGALASDISVKAFVDYTISKLTSRVNKNPNVEQVLIDACAESNSLTYDYSQFDSGFAGMGSTLVGAVINDNGMVNVVNVGDSRCYHLLPRSIIQVTTDHSLVEDLVRSGVITREEAKYHHQKSIITRAIGSEPAVQCDSFSLKMEIGDMLVLCSDGLTNYVSDELIYEQYLLKPNPQDFCNSLLDLVYSEGAGDNVTIVSVVR